MRYIPLLIFSLLPLSAFATERPDDKMTNDVVDVAAGLPVTIDDATVQELGTWSSQLITQYQHGVDGKNPLSIYPQLQYGLFNNAEFSFGIPYDLESVDGSHEDNLATALKYNFVEEQDFVPALALQEELTFPTADNEDGVDVSTTFMLTKHILPQYGVTALYLNASWTRFGKIEADERRNSFSAAAGFSHAITDKTALVADLVEANEEDKGRSDTIAELGFRHGINKDLILSFGSGFGLNHDAPDFSLTFGAEYGF